MGVNNISICSLYSILMLLENLTNTSYFLWAGPREWNIEDMYNMIWQEKTNTIVMLANVYEMGKVWYLRMLKFVFMTFV